MSNSVTFTTLHPDGSVTDTRVLPSSAIQACPHLILLPEHYRDDETCRCDDPEHVDMREWGYKWRKGAWQ